LKEPNPSKRLCGASGSVPTRHLLPMAIMSFMLLLVTVDAIRSSGLSGKEKDTELPQNYAAYLSAYDLVERRRNESADVRHLREQAFWKRHAIASTQNSQPSHARRWRAAASPLFDATEEELRSMMGYKPVVKGHHEGVNFLHIHEEAMNFSIPKGIVLPEGMDWRQRVKKSNLVRSQGACGSCWAISSSNALEMHLELSSIEIEGPLMVNELVQCTPNHHHCGGAGGCSGATAELAFQFVKDNGLSFEGVSGNTLCQEKQLAAGRRVMSRGFVHLPRNEAWPLLYALAVKGPVVVSADANNWETYGHGIFDGCGRNAAVNHAVLAVGYGKSVEGKYWTIRNSWGEDWGESGHIRLLRFDDHDHEMSGYCGTDYHPQEGVACDGETSPVPVCGMCGILFDSAFPVDVTVDQKSVRRGVSKGQTLRASR